MQTDDYDLDMYIRDVRAIAEEESDGRKAAERIRPLARRVAANPSSWMKPEYRQVDPEQGFGVHLVHEEPGHGLSVFVFAWPPGGGNEPHNHKTWGVVAGVEGEETEIGFNRLDDGSRPGYAELERGSEETLRPGKVGLCMPDDIHSVCNRGDVVSVSLHTYGRHLNYTGRSMFDVEARIEKPFDMTVRD